MSHPRSLKWIAIATVYGLALAVLAVLIAAESDSSVGTRSAEAGVFVAVPAVAFAAAAAPLWRESRNRLWLGAAGVVAFFVAVALAIATWGVALPVSGGLVAVAIADVDRVLALSGFRGSRRGVAFGVALLIGGAFVGLALPLAALLAVVGIVILFWKLVATRPRRTTGG